MRRALVTALAAALALAATAPAARADDYTGRVSLDLRWGSSGVAGGLDEEHLGDCSSVLRFGRNGTLSHATTYESIHIAQGPLDDHWIRYLRIWISFSSGFEILDARVGDLAVRLGARDIERADLPLARLREPRRFRQARSRLQFALEPRRGKLFGWGFDEPPIPVTVWEYEVWLAADGTVKTKGPRTRQATARCYGKIRGERPRAEGGEGAGVVRSSVRSLPVQTDENIGGANNLDGVVTVTWDARRA